MKWNLAMSLLRKLALFSLLACAGTSAVAAPAPVDYLTADFGIEQVLDWGERPVWSPDGTRIAFTKDDVEDGPAYELDLETRTVRCLTCRWGANGHITRIYYLPDNSFLLLAGPDLETTTSARGGGSGSGVGSTALYWMPAAADKPPQALKADAFGEIAILSRPQEAGVVRIAWGAIGKDASRIVLADLLSDTHRAVLTNRRVAYSYPSARGDTLATFAETYDFADGGGSVTFWTVEKGRLASAMYKLDLKSGKLDKMAGDGAHSETHVFPDERFGLEESNRVSDPSGPLRGISGLSMRPVTRFLQRDGHANAEEMAAPNSGKGFDLFIRSYANGRLRRLTNVSDLGGEAHQSSPAPDGRRIVFAMKPPKSGPHAGKAGIFVGTFGPASAKASR